MHEMTQANLRSAHGGESMAHMRYLVWGAQASKDGFANVGRLFEAVSFAERAHATGHFKALKNESGDFAVTSMAGFGLGTTSENLAGAIAGETFEIKEMYPAYLEVAQMQGEKAAIRSMTYAIEAERIHARMFAKAKKAVDAGEDVRMGAIQVCEICGHTLEGDAPETCPICGVKSSKFVAFA